jgi:hypothetical protein
VGGQEQVMDRKSWSLCMINCQIGELNFHHNYQVWGWFEHVMDIWQESPIWQEPPGLPHLVLVDEPGCVQDDGLLHRI